MNTSDFDYDLPTELIAQTPLRDRQSSRLLVLDRDTETISHQQFTDFTSHLQEGDSLVLNDTRVLPARLYGIKEDTGAKMEILLLHPVQEDKWEVLAKPAKKVKIGTTLIFGEGLLRATCVEEKAYGGRVLQFAYEGIFYELLERLGEMPLPPYITEQLPEAERYQTVYAKEKGSAAAPTAGLHFTNVMLEDIRKMGVNIVFITLHVGLGTFRPVQVDSIEEHDMHAEFYHMTKEAADTLNQTRENNGRIVAVGTTSTRTLETVMRDYGKFVETKGWTDIFIYPPYQFQAVDALLTNFHLPKSTLIMMISAFSYRDLILKAYNEAVKERYRFFSFGDAMLIL